MRRANTERQYFPWACAALICSTLLLASCNSSSSSSATLSTNNAGTNTDQENSPADPPPHCPKPDSWWAGTIEICGGRLSYRDYVFDDYGADTVPYARPNWDTLSASTGDVRYADHGADENTADLLVLELEPAGDRLKVSALLNTVLRASDALLAIAIDTGEGPTELIAWHESLIAASGINPKPLRAAGVDHVYLFDLADPDSNTIAGSLPMPEGEFRLWAVTASADGTVTNIAFRGPDESGNWMEDQQAAALATGDITDYGILLSPAVFAESRFFSPVGGEDYERVYRSDITIDRGDGIREGMSYDGVPGRLQNGADSTRQSFHTFGHHQPYSVYLPRGWDGSPAPLQLILHGNGGSHRQIIDQPGAQSRFGDDLGRVLLGPLGRGPESFYSDESERDVLDAWADLSSVVAIDPERVFSSGYSMGGYGSYRLGSLYPDRFAGLIIWVGPTGHGTNGVGLDQYGNNTSGYVGNVRYYWPNLLNTPLLALYGSFDELVPLDQALLVQREFARLANPHSFWLHSGEHLTFALADDWRKEAAASANFVRNKRPARIRFRVEPRIGSENLGLRHDSVWWLSEIRAHNTGYFEFADIDLTSGGCAGAMHDVISDVGTPDNQLGYDPVPWIGQHYRRTNSVQAPSGLSGSLANVSSLSIDISDLGACLEGSFTYELETTEQVTINFSDGRQLTLPGGQHSGILHAL
ncbi:MAG: hypothetical protein CMN85_13345 [Spongiibacteraceae bacterium]|nr:hypothetical protein [Spongiibacteraceae bacterium]